MVPHRLLILLLVTLFTQCRQLENTENNSRQKTKAENKPGTYWWWMGNAVDSANIDYNLEMMHHAGIGTVHVIPIYGVKGEEDKFLEYLSPEWANMLKYTSQKAGELGMEVDMTLGTGWCYGGSWVDDKYGIMGAEIETIENCKRKMILDLSRKSKHPIDTLLCVLADYGNGKRVELTRQVSNQKLTLPDSTSPATVYILRMQGPQRKVKRAAPGAEGPMLNPLSVHAFETYTKPFQKVFQGNAGKYISSIYHDSYEYYGASWSKKLFERFEAKRGYRLQEFLPELVDKGRTDLSKRVIADYRETVSGLHIEYIKAIKKWAEQNNTKFRDQAHGSPTNWLDTYAIADIPETESFGASIFKIPNLNRNEKYISPGNVPDMDVFKFASSAAHVTGKPLVSSETFTWLREHYRVALSQCKPELDKLFVSGINHVYFHGTAYSPKEAAWPGWLFYASTNFAPSNSQYNHLSAMSRYIENCQKILQSTKPDNEIVVYFPFQDILHNYNVQKDILLTINVHNQQEWLANSEFRKTLTELKNSGFGYDYISDMQLINSSTDGSVLKTSGNTYKTIIIPKCEYMPLNTIKFLEGLAESGVNIIFIEDLPETYSGYDKTKQSQVSFKEIKQKLQHLDFPNLKILNLNALSAQLTKRGNNRETLASYKLDFIRKKDENGYVYFIANLNSGTDINEYISIGTDSKDYIFYNPQTGEKGKAKIKKSGKDISVLMQLKQGQSLFLFANNKNEDIPNWKYTGLEKNRFSISGNWNLVFLKGGPDLPKPATISKLTSWTNLPDKMASYFSGMARYSMDFRFAGLNEENKYYIVFDKVKESVLIRLNGKEVITLFSHPFEADITRFLKNGENHLELEVVNLPANRIRYLDKQKVDWQKFYDINFVNINYKVFDASKWEPVESGLMGEISIVCYETE